MTETIQQRVKEIKQSFRLRMDGMASQSMREKGMVYHLNWGVSIPDLKRMAAELKGEAADRQGGEDQAYDLAIALWKENIRECKLLAVMLMPPGRLLPEVADLWMEQTPTIEVAEQLAFQLLQHTDFAAVMAFEWIATDGELRQVCGYQVLASLFAKGRQPNERGIQEFLDQALSALQSESFAVRKAALSAVRRFASLGEEYAQICKSALKTLNLEIF